MRVLDKVSRWTSGFEEGWENMPRSRLGAFQGKSTEPVAGEVRA